MRRLFSAALIAAGLLATALSGAVQRDLSHTNQFIILFPVELLGVLLGGVAAARWLASRRERAPGLLGVGVYLLLVAGAVSTLFPVWLPSDDTILGSALLAGLLGGVAANIALASAAMLAGWRPLKVSAAGIASGIVAFLLVTAGGMISPLFEVHIPLVTVAAAIGLALLLATRRGSLPWRSLGVAILGGIATVAILMLRGPGDWASASTSVKLYSFSILVMAAGISLVVADGERERRL